MENYNKKFEIGKHIPNAHKIIKEAQEKSVDFQKSMSAENKVDLNVKYGSSDRNTMDIFTPGPYVRATLIFLHGGYWLSSDKSRWSHLARGSL